MRPNGPPPWSEWFRLIAAAWFLLWLTALVTGLVLDYFAGG
jgi:hypothetical protein